MVNCIVLFLKSCFCMDVKNNTLRFNNNNNNCIDKSIDSIHQIKSTLKKPNITNFIGLSNIKTTNDRKKPIARNKKKVTFLDELNAELINQDTKENMKNPLKKSKKKVTFSDECSVKIFYINNNKEDNDDTKDNTIFSVKIKNLNLKQNKALDCSTDNFDVKQMTTDEVISKSCSIKNKLEGQQTPKDKLTLEIANSSTIPSLNMKNRYKCPFLNESQFYNLFNDNFYKFVKDCPLLLHLIFIAEKNYFFIDKEFGRIVNKIFESAILYVKSHKSEDLTNASNKMMSKILCALHIFNTQNFTNSSLNEKKNETFINFAGSFELRKSLEIITTKLLYNEIFQGYNLTYFLTIYYGKRFTFDDQNLPSTSDLNIFINDHLFLCKTIFLYLLNPCSFDKDMIVHLKKQQQVFYMKKKRHPSLARYYLNIDNLIELFK